VASPYQSTHDASASCDDHASIVGAIANRDPEGAALQMLVHIGDVESALGKASAAVDPLERLRASLAPLKPRGD
jgi:DNA-binding GntR family transcriptional regulator